MKPQNILKVAELKRHWTYKISNMITDCSVPTRIPLNTKCCTLSLYYTNAVPGLYRKRCFPLGEGKQGVTTRIHAVCYV